MAHIVDIETPRIERQIGDARGRTPHLTQDLDNPDGPLVLYVPQRNGMWAAKVFEQVADAVAHVEALATGQLQQP